MKKLIARRLRLAAERLDPQPIVPVPVIRVITTAGMPWGKATFNGRPIN